MFVLADIMIILMMVLVAIACIAVVVSKVTSARKNRSVKMVNGIHAKRITYIATASTIVVLALTFLLLPSENMMINGEEYAENYMIRLANMSVASSLILIAAAVISIIYGMMQDRRSGNRKDIASMLIRINGRKKRRTIAS